VKRTFDPLVLADLAAEQWGLLTAAQAGKLGVSAQQVARMAAGGILERLRHGVYRLAGNPANPLDEIRAAWLSLEPAATAADHLTQKHPGVLSHRSAAHVHHLGDVDADAIEFTVPRRKQSRSGDVQFHIDSTLQRSDWTLVDGFPVTTIETTIGQLAAERLDGGHLAGVVRDALVTHHLDIEAITAVLRPSAHYYGVPLGAASELVELLLDQAGIPETTRRIGARAERNNNFAGLAAASGMPPLDDSTLTFLAAIAANLPRLDISAGAAVFAAAANLPLLDSSVTAFLAAARKNVPELDPALIAGLQNLALSAAIKDTVAQIGKVMTPQVTAQLASLLREDGQLQSATRSPGSVAALADGRHARPQQVVVRQVQASKPATE